MRRNGHGPRRRGVGRLGPRLVATLLLSTAAPLLGRPPPQGKTYFTVFLGIESPLSANADCLRFKKSKLCFSGGGCGSWERIDAADPGAGFGFEITWDRSGSPIIVQGKATLADEGADSTFSGAGRAKAGGKRFNFALTGRATSRRNCKSLLREWEWKGGRAEALLE